MFFVFIAFLFSICLVPEIVTLVSAEHHTKEGRVVIDPYKLINLIAEEKLKQADRTEKTIYELMQNKVWTTFSEDIALPTESECHDEETLRARKVWSRWSKWGDCSVTCGDGMITRSRSCVSGRCAPGEQEVQHRPCTRVPCDYMSKNTIEEMHY